MKRALKLAIASMASTSALMAAAVPAIAQAQRHDVSARAFNIPAQPLDQALMQLADQASISVLVPGEMARGRRAPAVSGSITPEQALDRLLRGSGLTYRSNGGGAYTIQVQATDVRPTQTGATDQVTPTESDEILVTARRVTERAQDVPIAIATLTSENLENAGITDTQQLVQVTPALRMDGVGFFVAPAIRGVTSNQASVSSDANVATYIDGIYQQTTTGAVFSLPDVTQVQVLRGPQGTLFGRNATGGAILITTRDPELDDVTGSVNLSVGRFDQVIARAFVSAPLVEDRLAVSLSGYYNQYDGFYDNIATGETGGGLEDYLVRGKIRWAPTAGTDFVFTALYSNRRDEDGDKLYSLDGNNTFSTIPGAIIADQPYQFSSDVDPFVDGETLGVSLRGTFDLGPGALTSTTAYTGFTSAPLYDADYTNLPLITALLGNFSNTVTQELVYSTDQLGNFQTTVGAFYYDNDAGFNIDVNDGAQFVTTDEPTTAWALFGEATYAITDNLEVLGGIRYSSERRTAEATISVFGTTVATMSKQEESFTALTPRVSVIYNFTDDNNIYFTYSQGFKSGLFNAQSLQTDPIQPEELTAYEVGSKNRFGDISLNVSAFYYDYTDLQVSNVVQDGINFITIVNNAASSEIYGGELEASWRPSNDFTLSAGLSYLHARYDSFPNASATVPVGTFADSGLPATGPAACNFENIIPSGLGNQALACDASGNSLIRSPDWSGNVTANYTLHVGQGLVNLSGNAYFTSEIYYDAINRIEQPGYAMFSARIGWQPDADRQFEIALWGKNLSDETVLMPDSTTEIADAGRADMPQTYGVELSYAF